VLKQYNISLSWVQANLAQFVAAAPLLLLAWRRYDEW
jgi:hypothetical protein